MIEGISRIDWGRVRSAIRAAAFETAEAALDAAVSAPVLTAATIGMPVASPCTSMFAALTTRSAARLTSPDTRRSEEHTSELQSLMRISYAVFCLKKKTRI